jgi:hypothetical protein
MPFVAKVIGPEGQVRWLTTPRSGGLRVLGPRETAEVFDTQECAATAIGATVLSQPCDGLTFSTAPAFQDT